MEDILRGYSVNGATWFYLSLLLIVAVYFRFGRVFSLRNLDLALLLSLSPGVLLVGHLPRAGYAWLFSVTAILLLRLLFDPALQRRPRLPQNLNPPGLAFLGLSAFAFLMTIVVTDPPPQATVETVGRAENLLNREDSSQRDAKPEAGPASSLLAAPVVPLSNAVAAGNVAPNEPGEVVGARIIVILAHVAVVAGLVFVGARHFGELQLGLAMATLYLLLPCTAYDVGRFNHVLPSALVVWAFAAYRWPVLSGGLMGLACGTLFFPAFLLPLWIAFYGRRGSLRFVGALAIVGTVLLACMAQTSSTTHSFVQQTIGSIDWRTLFFRDDAAGGFWSLYDPAYRIPVLVTYLVMLVALAVWPRKKNFEHLLTFSAALIVGTQFWYPHQGGVYLLWYLPLAIMVAFRPRLAHLVPPEFKTAETSKVAVSPPIARELAVSAGLPDRHFFR
jgi:hypothetical protein